MDPHGSAGAQVYMQPAHLDDTVPARRKAAITICSRSFYSDAHTGFYSLTSELTHWPEMLTPGSRQLGVDDFHMLSVTVVHLVRLLAFVPDIQKAPRHGEESWFHHLANTWWWRNSTVGGDYAGQARPMV